MKKVWLFLAFILFFTAYAHATSIDSLKTNYAQGGNPTKIYSIIGSGQLFIGPCRLLSASMFSSTAGDIVGIYNTVDPRYPITDLEFELGISANNTNSAPINPNAPFENGIRVLATNANSITTVVFDY